MAHGSPSIHKCDKCKVYGRMARFNSHRKCKKGHNTETANEDECEKKNYKWIGWFKNK